MGDIFKSKKTFLVDYTVNSKSFSVIVNAVSAERAREKFVSRMEEHIEGIYPYPIYEVTGVRRVYKKIQM